jgi:ectoine hydroxylase-related dioxygenase (phytanoyl-CoA dioxygenase family)
LVSREVKPAALHIPELKELLTPEIIKIASDYYGNRNFEVSHVTAWRNYYLGITGLSKDLYSNLWHNDQSPLGTLKMFLLLSDGVTRDNGATKVLDISQTKRVMRTGYFERKYVYGPARKFLSNQNNFTVLEGDSGFAFIFNPQLAVHAAGLVAEGKFRDVAVITIRPSETPLREDWEVKVIEADQNFMQKTARM